MVGAETVRADNPSLLSHGRRNDDLVRVVVSKCGRLPKDAQIFTDKRNTTLIYRDPKEAIEKLGALGMTHVFCEGGLKLARSLAAAGLVDEWIAVIAPKVIGSSPIDEATIIPDVSVIADTKR
jgi:diaminohydroxyphosphoribosylaminopyrimidine deaminase/5-amino-6-(5-phosphoribosylamino)uracil reductase